MWYGAVPSNIPHGVRSHITPARRAVRRLELEHCANNLVDLSIMQLETLLLKGPL